MQKIVVVGGGTGSAVVLSGLKQAANVELSAITVVSDNGGSTGRLRDEFGFLPVGDLRQCIAALAKGENEKEIRQLLLYRFDQQSSLQGHNLGNLILTALESITGSPARAIEVASKIFRTRGTVLPVSEDLVNLVIHYANGQVVTGEKYLDDPLYGGQKIKQISLDKKAQIYNQAAKTLIKADLIILGPGDLYGSLLPNTLVHGFNQALAVNQKAGGKLVYVSNLVTHFSQTHQMSIKDHLSEVQKYTQRIVDVIIINQTPIPESILKNYQAAQDFPIVDDLKNKASKTQIIRTDLLATKIIHKDKNDNLPRSLIRHDKQKLAKILLNL